MALTISPIDALAQDVWGRHRVRVVTVTFDDDLDEAGEAITAADLSLSEIHFVAVEGLSQSSSGAEVTALVHVKHVDASNITVHLNAYSASDFLGDNLDASTYSVRLLIVGV